MNPERHQFRHLERLRVRWVEVDLQRIVFNGHYLMYLDTAVAGWWRAMAMPYQETMAGLSGDLYVRKATLEYLGPARYDEQLAVGVRTQRLGNSSMVLQGAVFRGDELLVHGELVYVFADPATMRSQPLPTPLRDLLLAFDADQAMVDLRCGDWSTLGAQARAIRQQVFVQEQRIPAALEWDQADAGALHALAVNRLGLAVATGRLLVCEPGVGRIGRMVVLPSLRGGGLGRRVLQALVAAARTRGDRQLMLHAQASAVEFYLRAGFVPQGPVFEEAGIAHQEMVLAL